MRLRQRVRSLFPGDLTPFSILGAYSLTPFLLFSPERAADNSQGREPLVGKHWQTTLGLSMTLPTKPKTQVTEAFPPAFVKFMKEVDAKIERGDPSTTIESDDLLQCDHTFGGLVDVNEAIFGFEYVAEDQDDDDGFSHDGFPVAWHYLLTREQIRQITENKLSTIPMWRCTKDCGRRATTPQWYCPECDFPP